MTITALPPAPSRADPANFATKADALLGAFDTFVSETNTTAANVDTKNTNVNTKSTNVDTKSALVDGYAVSALSSKNSATASESTATTNAATTSSKATTATAKALEASNSAASALSSKNAASNLALNVASTRASIRPTLLLDFASTKKLDSRVTFTRSSTATVFNERGVMQTVASGVPRFDHDPVTGESLGFLLEESRTNLFTYSDRFEDTSWGKSNSIIVPNIIIAPSGDMVASKLVASNSLSGHYVAKSVALIENTTYSFTIFLKSGEYSQARINFRDKNSSFNSAVVSLVDGSVIGTPSAGLTVTTKLLSNGWLYLVVVVQSGTGSGSPTFYIYPAVGGSDAFTGDGTSGIYIWRAGLELGAFPTSSIETPAVFTGRASTATFIGSNGLIQTAASGVARYQYTPSDLTIPPYLLLESAGTNLALYSDDWTGGSTFSGWNMGAGFFRSMIASDHPQRASGFQVCAFGPNSGVNSFSNSINKQTITSLGAAGTYCIYADFKATGATTTVRFLPAVVDGGSGVVGGVFSLTNESVIADSFVAGDSFSSSALSILALGNNWYRCIISFVTTRAIGNMYLRGFPYIGNSPLTGDGTSGLLGTGMQLVLGDRPTSAIPTTTSQVTRAADTSTSSQVTRAADSAVMTGVNFSSWYRQDEGTLYADVVYGNLTAIKQIFSVGSGSSSSVLMRLTSDGNNVSFQVLNTTTEASLSLGTVSSSAKITGAYKVNNFAGVLNGGGVLTDTSGTIPAVDSAFIGSRSGSDLFLNGTIKKLAFYPKRLSNIELVGLTS